MHRIIARFVSLSLTSLFVSAGLVACASEEPTYDSSSVGQGSNQCIVQFCNPPAGAKGCCIQGTNQCGADFGNGCIAVTRDGG
jgi:hypothetical protein